VHRNHPIGSAGRDREAIGSFDPVGPAGHVALDHGRGATGGTFEPVATVAFLHAHPDDEAIFSGGTMCALADAGHRVVLIVATGGELGLDVAVGSLGHTRRAEVQEAARHLGIHAVHHLGFRDSGMAGDPANRAPGAFVAADTAVAAERVANVLETEAADTVVVYDDHGIYGHPDHVQGHVVGLAAAELVGAPHRYEMTVDREYLHFVETHLVEEAALGGDLGLAGSRIGTSSVEVDLTLDVRAHLAAKRMAMAAHRSQLPEHAPVFGLPPDRFADVYGWEWYRRRGPRGPLEELGQR
jgi:LmbE family N-acetylglucosaminyl deacetylase